MLLEIILIFFFEYNVEPSSLKNNKIMLLSPIQFQKNLNDKTL